MQSKLVQEIIFNGIITYQNEASKGPDPLLTAVVGLI